MRAAMRSASWRRSRFGSVILMAEARVMVTRSRERENGKRKTTRRTLSSFPVSRFPFSDGQEASPPLEPNPPSRLETEIAAFLEARQDVLAFPPGQGGPAGPRERTGRFFEGMPLERRRTAGQQLRVRHDGARRARQMRPHLCLEVDLDPLPLSAQPVDLVSERRQRFRSG